MSDPNTPEAQPTPEATESFADAFAQYEKIHSRKPEETSKALEGTVIAVTADSVLVDIGFKSEGIFLLTEFQNDREPPKPGDKLLVSVKGRNPEGYYELTRGKVERPADWDALEKAFNEKTTIVGTVTGVVKGGLSVDVGVRAFMPASRSGTREAAEMEKLVGQEIGCRITKLNVTEWSRKTFGKITDEIHAANSIVILNVDTNGNFTGLLDGEVQQGPGLQIYPTTNTASYSIYFVNPSDQTFRQTVGIRGVSTNTITLADSVTNTMAFSAQDLSGNILTNNLNSRVIHLTLEFYQPERYQQGSYYYQLETSVKQRITQ